MNAMPHLLVVDDDDEILSLLTKFFRKHGYAVSVAGDGVAMFAALAREKIDIVILDLMLQGEDGFSLCGRLRATSRLPVIMLTAMADHADRVVGLEIGADDYLVKPFDARELLARVRAVLRRTAERDAAPQTPPAAADRDVIRFAGWTIDLARREVRSADHSLVLLSAGEYDLLLAFVEHPQRVLSRDQLLDFARGQSHLAYDRSIDVQVSRLRHKIEEDPKTPEIIKTVRNGGYIFTPQVKRG